MKTCAGCEKKFAWLKVAAKGRHYCSDACAHYDSMFRAKNIQSTPVVESISAEPGDTSPVALGEGNWSEKGLQEIEPIAPSTQSESTGKTLIKPEPNPTPDSAFDDSEIPFAHEHSRTPAKIDSIPTEPFDGSQESFVRALSPSMNILDQSIVSMSELMTCVGKNIQKRADAKDQLDHQQVNAMCNVGQQMANLMRVKLGTYKLAHKLSKRSK